MPFLKPLHIEPSLPTIAWDRHAGKYTIFRDGHRVPLTDPFAVDVHMTKHGYSVWVESGETKPDGSPKRVEQTHFVSVMCVAPEPPPGATPCYAVPANSKEIGGVADLRIAGAAAAPFVAWFEDQAAALNGEDDARQLPIVVVTSKDSEFGLLPEFETVKMMPRPDHWRTPIVNFNR